MNPKAVDWLKHTTDSLTQQASEHWNARTQFANDVAEAVAKRFEALCVPRVDIRSFSERIWRMVPRHSAPGISNPLGRFTAVDWKAKLSTEALKQGVQGYVAALKGPRALAAARVAAAVASLLTIGYLLPKPHEEIPPEQPPVVPPIPVQPEADTVQETNQTIASFPKNVFKVLWPACNMSEAPLNRVQSLDASVCQALPPLTTIPEAQIVSTFSAVEFPAVVEQVNLSGSNIDLQILEEAVLDPLKNVSTLVEEAVQPIIQPSTPSDVHERIAALTAPAFTQLAIPAVVVGSCLLFAGVCWLATRKNSSNPSLSVSSTPPRTPSATATTATLPGTNRELTTPPGSTATFTNGLGSLPPVTPRATGTPATPPPVSAVPTTPLGSSSASLPQSTATPSKGQGSTPPVTPMAAGTSATPTGRNGGSTILPGSSSGSQSRSTTTSTNGLDSKGSGRKRRSTTATPPTGPTSSAGGPPTTPAANGTMLNGGIPHTPVVTNSTNSLQLPPQTPSATTEVVMGEVHSLVEKYTTDAASTVDGIVALLLARQLKLRDMKGLITNEKLVIDLFARLGWMDIFLHVNPLSAEGVVQCAKINPEGLSVFMPNGCRDTDLLNRLENEVGISRDRLMALFPDEPKGHTRAPESLQTTTLTDGHQAAPVKSPIVKRGNKLLARFAEVVEEAQNRHGTPKTSLVSSPKHELTPQLVNGIAASLKELGKQGQSEPGDIAIVNQMISALECPDAVDAPPPPPPPPALAAPMTKEQRLQKQQDDHKFKEDQRIKQEWQLRADPLQSFQSLDAKQKTLLDLKRSFREVLLKLLANESDQDGPAHQALSNLDKEESDFIAKNSIFVQKNEGIALLKRYTSQELCLILHLIAKHVLIATDVLTAKHAQTNSSEDAEELLYAQELLKKLKAVDRPEIELKNPVSEKFAYFLSKEKQWQTLFDGIGSWFIDDLIGVLRDRERDPKLEPKYEPRPFNAAKAVEAGQSSISAPTPQASLLAALTQSSQFSRKRNIDESQFSRPKLTTEQLIVRPPLRSTASTTGAASSSSLAPVTPLTSTRNSNVFSTTFSSLAQGQLATKRAGFSLEFYSQLKPQKLREHRRMQTEFMPASEILRDLKYKKDHEGLSSEESVQLTDLEQKERSLAELLQDCNDLEAFECTGKLSDRIREKFNQQEQDFIDKKMATLR